MSKKNKAFSDCLKKASRDHVVSDPKRSFYNETYKCLDHVIAVCSSEFRDNFDRHNACHKNITAAQSNASEMVPPVFRAYDECLRELAENTAHCRSLLSETCETSSLVAVKVIRLHASLVSEVMQLNPRLKVIHFLRDPRGIVLSRYSAGLLSRVAGNEVIPEAKFLCERMQYDIEVFKHLNETFPGRIMALRYEDLVQAPVLMTKKVYAFLGRKAPLDVLDWFKNSMSGMMNTGVFGTQRMDSKQTAFHWREILREPSSSTIDYLCAKVISHLAKSP